MTHAHDPYKASEGGDNMHLNHEQAIKYDMLPSSLPKDVENNLSKIQVFEGSETNKRLILEFDRQNKTNGNKLATRNTYLAALRHLQQFAQKYTDDKSFRKFTKDDIIGFLEIEKQRRFDDTRYKRRHGKPINATYSACLPERARSKI